MHRSSVIKHHALGHNNNYKTKHTHKFNWCSWKCIVDTKLTFFLTRPKLISSGCSLFLSVVVWKGLRWNNFHCWPKCFVKEVIKSYIIHKLMLFCEVLKEAAMIFVTTHTFLSCIYLFKVRITKKEKLLVATVYLGWHSKG